MRGQHTARCIGILVYIEHYALVRRIVPRLTRKQVRQDEPDHPGYEVETQKNF
jgi:hypothetical protein